MGAAWEVPIDVPSSGGADGNDWAIESRIAVASAAPNSGLVLVGGDAARARN
jgi:hypothetical protein